MWDPSAIVSDLIENHTGEKAVIVFQTKESVDELKKRGFYRVWANDEPVDVSSLISLPASLEVVLDRLVIRDEPRLSDSIEMAWREGNGRMAVIFVKQSAMKKRTFSSENACEECRIEVPNPYPLLFSFNHPVGACSECKGFGNILKYDEDLIIPDKSLSLSKGAVDPWNKPAYRWWQKQIIKSAPKEGLDINKPYTDFNEKEKALLFKGNSNFYGIDDFFEDMEARRYKLHVRVFLSRYRRPVICPQCSGKRLRRESLAYKLSGLDIAELCRFPVSEALSFFDNLDASPFQKDMAKEILRQIHLKLVFMKRVGLDYLGLNRDGRTLSGGEYQRVNLSNQIASFLTGTLYVLDEPTVGLHARDTDIIAGIMADLSKLGNTVLVVEHDSRIIGAADWIVELGPGGGHLGGEVVFSGPREDFLQTDTVTAKYMRGIDKEELPAKGRSGSGEKLRICGASGNNLKSVDLMIPLQTLTTISGVSGSGKSSLVVETLYRALAREFKTEFDFPLPHEKIEGARHLKGVKLISQAPIGRSPRSNPVTYLKIFDLIRKLFSEQMEAKAHGYGPGFFSFNVSGGRCETCQGAGYQKMEMYFFEDLYVKCEECNGQRYRPDALRVTYRGKNIVDVLAMTVDEAAQLYHDKPHIKNKLSLMKDIGLGYLRLGQPATTLSGGEAQRLKICAEMAHSPSTKVQKGFLYILDEPTIGLHFRDVQALLDVLHRLVDTGNTVVIIEHNLDVIRASDWIVDLGPEGGEKGGRIIFEGRPDEIVNVKESYTGRYLKNYSDNASIEK
jgi:excinuclease ABC subunit A